VIRGGYSAAANEAINQGLDIQEGYRSELNGGKIGTAGVTGAVGAIPGYEGARAGSMIGVISKDYSKTNTLSEIGGVTGNVAGTTMPEMIDK
jgi:hypothetical protein